MSSQNTGYRIVDEPIAGSLGHLVVQPFWPLLAGMLGGLWLGLPWLIFNAHAMGSATRKRETALGVLAFLLIAGSAVLIAVLARETGERTIQFMVLGLQLLKLATYYVLQMMQSRSFELHQYYGGTVRNGTIVVIGGALARTFVMDLLGNSLLILVFS
jgi:hypothetical protein